MSDCTPETLRALAEILRRFAADNLPGAPTFVKMAMNVDAHADAWVVLVDAFRAVGDALQEAGFMPLGDDYASSVQAMSDQLAASQERARRLTDLLREARHGRWNRVAEMDALLSAPEPPGEEGT